MLSLAVVLLLIGCCIGGQTQGTKLRQRAGRSRCPLGFIQYKSSCYLFSLNTATYAEALSFCSYFGDTLAEISSRNEDDFMRGLGYLKRNGGGFSYYIGVTDLHIEDIWTWEKPLRKISYLNWNANQPDNAG